MGEGRGPKYQRYFFAYSDKMIARALHEPTTIMQAMVGAPYRADIALKDELLVIEFPQTSGDIGGRYGVVAVPIQHSAEFRDRGPRHVVRQLRPRELDPVQRGLVYLDFDVAHHALGEVNESLLEYYAADRVIPYRVSVLEPPMDQQLAACGYTCALHIPYMEFQGLALRAVGVDHQPRGRKVVFGVEQNPHIHLFHVAGGRSSLCEKLAGLLPANKHTV